MPGLDQILLFVLYGVGPRVVSSDEQMVLVHGFESVTLV